MSGRVKFIIGFIILNLIIFGILFYVNEVRADVPNALFNKLAQGYKLKAIGSNIYVYNDCDTLIYPKFQFTQEELQKISRTYQVWLNTEQKRNRAFKEWMVNYWKQDIADIPYIPPTYSGHFVVREDLSLQLDSTKAVYFKRTRKSLTQAQGYYWYVYRFAVEDTGRAYLENHEQLNNIYYLVPFTATRDILNTYLNDPASIPKWTEEIP